MADDVVAEVGLDHCHVRMRPDTVPAVTVPSGSVSVRDWLHIARWLIR